MRKFVLAGAAAMLVSGGAIAPSAGLAETHAAHILVTKDQRAMEEQAQQLLKMNAVNREIARSTAYLKALPGGVSVEDLADVDAYVHDLAFCVALAVINADPGRPRVLFNGFPGAQYGLVNPDTIYRYIPLSSESHYQISGRLGGSDHVSFELTDTAPFTGGRLGKNFGTLSSETLRVAPDGSFTITLGPDAADGRSNHFQIPADATLLMIRDSMSDWSQAPMDLSVRRISGPSNPVPNEKTLAERVASGLAVSTKLWVKIPQIYSYNVPENTLPPPKATGAGGLQGQYNSGGNYKLSDDQVLVITARKGTARYLGFQLGSNWYVPFDYATHSSSLTNRQAAANPDGSYTFVVALRDPGVANWLDPVGHPTGLTLMRWQGVDRPLTAEEAPVVRLVRFADLARALPPGTPMMTPTERTQQLQQRQRQVAQRRAAAGIPHH